jgi:hypothetical protein
LADGAGAAAAVDGWAGFSLFPQATAASRMTAAIVIFFISCLLTS